METKFHRLKGWQIAHTLWIGTEASAKNELVTICDKLKLRFNEGKW